MEQYPVRKIEKPIDWCVTVPGSKSMTNRALLMAALSDGTVTLDGVLFSDDSRHFISSLTALGFDVLVEEEKRRVTVKGEGGTIPKKEAEIDVGSAGTAARFLTAMLGMSDGSPHQLQIPLDGPPLALGADAPVAVGLGVGAVMDIAAPQEGIVLAVGHDQLAEALGLQHGAAHHITILNALSVVGTFR